MSRERQSLWRRCVRDIASCTTYGLMGGWGGGFSVPPDVNMAENRLRHQSWSQGKSTCTGQMYGICSHMCRRDRQKGGVGDWGGWSQSCLIQRCQIKQIAENPLCYSYRQRYFTPFCKLRLTLMKSASWEPLYWEEPPPQTRDLGVCWLNWDVSELLLRKTTAELHRNIWFGL